MWKKNSTSEMEFDEQITDVVKNNKKSILKTREAGSQFKKKKRSIANPKKENLSGLVH